MAETAVEKFLGKALAKVNASRLASNKKQLTAKDLEVASYYPVGEVVLEEDALVALKDCEQFTRDDNNKPTTDVSKDWGKSFWSGTIMKLNCKVEQSLVTVKSDGTGLVPKGTKVQVSAFDLAARTVFGLTATGTYSKVTGLFTKV